MVRYPWIESPLSALFRKEDFVGGVILREEAGLSLAGQATLEGCVAITTPRRSEVARLLPPELELAPRSDGESEHHPLVFVFGDLTAGATIFGGLTLLLGVSYQEFALVVPAVRLRGTSHLYGYVPRMYSNYFPAIWSGNVFYGLSKQLAEMGRRGHNFAIRGLRGEALFSASVRSEDPWLAARAGGLAELDAVSELFRIPILGRRASGAYLRCYFDWSLGSARVRRVQADLHVEPTLAHGLEPGTHPSHSVTALELTGLVWRLSFPEPLCIHPAAARAPRGAASPA